MTVGDPTCNGRRFRRRPTYVQAVQYDGKDETLHAFVGGQYGERWQHGFLASGGVLVRTMSGNWCLASPGDWIVQGEGGSFWVVEKDAWDKTYEPADG